MKYLQPARVALYLLALTACVQSKLVVYGPQDLIDEFTAVAPLDSKATSKSTPQSTNLLVQNR